MADCERGLERPERAIALAASPEAETLDASAKVEGLAIVVSGARETWASWTRPSRCSTRSRSRAASASSRRASPWRSPSCTRLQAARAMLQVALVRFTDDEIRAASGEVDEEDDVVVYDLSEAHPRASGR